MSELNSYCCPLHGCEKSALLSTPEGLSCPNGHFFPYAPGTLVPIFASESENTTEYSIVNAAEVHDNALRWVFSTFEADEPSLRTRLIARLKLKKGARVLVTGAGAGNDLPYLVSALSGGGEVFAQDIAKEMLLAGMSRYSSELGNSGVKLNFSVSDATNLPFKDGYFDAAYHFGGINLFPDIAKGISEMNRVVRSGGTIVIGDEGLAPWLVDTEFGRMLINNNPLYACTAPLSAIPEKARDVNISWELSNCFYVIDFQVSDATLPLNIDMPHLGKRGGTIRTRYFGKLEGVTPSLRNEIYSEAERRGVSRVSYIEAALRQALRKDVE